MTHKTEEAKQRAFWSRVNDKGRGPDECWLWQGGVTPKGYGICYWNGKADSAHRVAYQLHYGATKESMEGKIVRHRCGGHACCNPFHLYLADRAFVYDGENHWNTRLTDDEVLEILQFNREGWSQMWIARRFGISQTTVSSLVRGRHRRYLTVSIDQTEEEAEEEAEESKGGTN